MPGCPSLVSCIPEGPLPGVVPIPPSPLGPRDPLARLSTGAHRPGVMLRGDRSKRELAGGGSRRQGGPYAQNARPPVLCPAVSWGGRCPQRGRTPTPSRTVGRGPCRQMWARPWPCWAEQHSRLLDDAPEAAGEGTARAGSAGYRGLLSPSAFPQGGLGQLGGLQPLA